MNGGTKVFPLKTEKFANWVHQVNGNGEVINLFMDYETFGEHQWPETGIFDFLYHLPQAVLNGHNDFVTCTEAVNRYSTHGHVNIADYISWADQERDLSAWRSNHMQWDALEQIYKIENRIKATNNPQLIEDWRRMQTSDHFYYMCTKFWSDGDVHKYFSPYESPYEAFIYFSNALHDLTNRLETIEQSKVKNTQVEAIKQFVS